MASAVKRAVARMNKRYATALDHDGTAIAGTTKAFRVHFSR